MKRYLVFIMALLVAMPTQVFLREKWLLESVAGPSEAKSKKVAKHEKPALDEVVQPTKKAFSVTDGDRQTMGYDYWVKNVASKKKKGFKLEFNVTSTVPVNVSMTDKRLVFEQVDDGTVPQGARQYGAGKVLDVNVSKLGMHLRERFYKVPAWPFCAKPFEEKDKIELHGRYRHAGNSFSSRGHTQDITRLVFGECPIYVRDILLASKLVENGDVQDYSSGSAVGGYLGDVAGHLLCFDGSVDEFQISIGYVRHFRKNDISVGVEIPFVQRKHNLKLTTSVNSALRSNEAFQEKYGSNFNEFVKDLLCAKDIALTEGDTEIGIGDVSAFINFEVRSKHFERMIFGAKVLFPTAKERDVHKLWGPELGNGGFTELTAFGSVLFSHNNFFNPHIFMQATYGLPAEVTRRIPSCKKYTETSLTQIHELGSLLAMGELVRTRPTTDFSGLDTIFRKFSTETGRIRIRKGAEFNIRVGNVFEKFVANGGFADMYYDLRLKGCDYLNTRTLVDSCLGCLFAPDILTQNTYQIEHRVGGDVSYQFDEHVRLMLGMRYSFAGRNIPKRLEANVVFSVEF